MQFTATNEDYLLNIFKDIKRNAKFPLNIFYEPVKQLKTKKQLGFIFGGLVKALRQYYFDIQGELWDPEDIKNMLYHKIGMFECKQYPDGGIYTTLKTLSVMTKEETSEFINKVLNYIEEETECILTPDLRLCWLLHITEADIEYAKLFKISERNQDYLRYQKGLTCLNCGKYGCEAHHVKLPHYASMAEKPPDWLSISLCHECHLGKVHQKGQNYIIEGINLYGFDIETYCKLAYIKWLKKK